MTTNDEADLRLRRDMKRMANGNEALMDGTTASVKRLIEENEVVFGVWKDAAKPYLIGYPIIKGQRLLREVAASSATGRTRMTAI
jgi:hypothetical protein